MSSSFSSIYYSSELYCFAGSSSISMHFHSVFGYRFSQIVKMYKCHFNLYCIVTASFTLIYGASILQWSLSVKLDLIIIINDVTVSRKSVVQALMNYHCVNYHCVRM